MHKDEIHNYRSPGNGESLKLKDSVEEGGEIQEGILVSDSGEEFPIRDGVVFFAHPETLSETDLAALNLYEERADVYDKYLHLTFETFGEDEDAVRKEMVDRLNLQPDSHVLEVGAGTCRDSVYLAEKLGPSGKLYCQDLSGSMLQHCRAKLDGMEVPVEYGVANACYLPFPDNSLDMVFQFGGVGEFSDVSRFFREVARVTRPGGRVVVGDESMPPWLRDTEFAAILITTNPQYNASLPLEHLPIEARNVNLRWIIGGVFYMIDFDLGEGEPEGNFDFPIPGGRGGTLRSRYYGQLEGVQPETKELAQKARAKLGMSMHDWLDQVVRRAARDDLDKNS